MSKELQVSKEEKAAAIQTLITEVAKAEGIPPTGITILGGKPYVNVTGLDVKLKTLCGEKNLELKEISATKIVEPTKENGFLCGYHAEVILFDAEGFLRALKALKETGKEVVEEIRTAFTRRFTGDGFSSPDTCEGVGWKYKWTGYKQKVKEKILIENIIMMGERRATNRAKREATGTGLTSVDEMPSVISEPAPPEERIIDITPAEVEKEKPQKATWRPEVYQKITTPEFKAWAQKHAYPTMRDVRNSIIVHYDMKDVSEITMDTVDKWVAFISKPPAGGEEDLADE